MENKDKSENIRKAKAPIADETHKLNPSVTGQTKGREEEEPGKLPKDEFGVDHNSDPILAKNQ